MFGVFPHRSLDVTHPLMRGLDDVFYIPHSRHTEILRQDIAQVKDLQILAYSDIAGVCLLSDMECRNFFSTGHSEYDRDTLAKEYFRDKSKGLDIDRPYNYFPHDDENLVPLVSWKSTASLIFLTGSTISFTNARPTTSAHYNISNKDRCGKHSGLFL